MKAFLTFVFNILCVVVVVTMLVCCWGCAFSPVQKTIVLNMAAQSSGVILAQQLPKVAGEVLKYSEKVLEINSGNLSEATFHEWTKVMVEKLDVHPLLKVNFNELMKLVKIEVTLAADRQEMVKLFFNVIRNFTIGIKAGQDRKINNI